MEHFLDLVRQQRELQNRISATYKSEIKEIVATIARAMLAYGITTDEIVQAMRAEQEIRPRRKHLPKYIDPASGRTWSGRGPIPKWLVGKNPDDFLLPPD
ncbi:MULTISPECIES: H-NS histone family protein [Burkholderia cepacia complex]|uniref:H-NS histone family protein n=1 Tax=Burkholderia cepacia complex TaxID=87882 RepID=UPI0022EA4220|nr:MULTISPECIES: H-NS histone family protein [Burkholderia cepacia complex]MDA3672498.1 H-NS histone family protein [Burkholderia cenocepacia]MDA3681471.1 H-NS histone family protein [Burkholderia cenocepacia]MDA3689294.1 H-NS histone family protein [Burkholderia cenocepacia]MDA3696780.1 H-NS histone family protein [Burkholderia cenocepacia]MDA3704104.1 H-NS histone family protein [Burkholderia cenocepacia]